MARTKRSTKPKATYKAEVWTTVGGPNGIHDLWAIVRNDGMPVGFGGQQFCEESASAFNRGEVYMAKGSVVVLHL